MGYGVIGNTTVSGTVILGSSPGIPANILVQDVAAPSYSGLVLRPLTAATPVQIRLGSQAKIPRFIRSGGFFRVSECNMLRWPPNVAAPSPHMAVGATCAPCACVLRNGTDYTLSACAQVNGVCIVLSVAGNGSDSKEFRPHRIAA